jgi:hypothetical protein
MAMLIGSLRPPTNLQPDLSQNIFPSFIPLFTMRKVRKVRKGGGEEGTEREKERKERRNGEREGRNGVRGKVRFSRAVPSSPPPFWTPPSLPSH